MSDKRILVLMSSCNGEKYIESQIRSIMAQSISSQIHLRIRDDGSQDNTCKVIKHLTKEFPGKIELLYGRNQGCNSSFFELLNSAAGYDYYALSDQDDIWLPSKLETALKALETEDDTIPLLYASTSYLAGDDLIPYGQTRRKQRPFSIYNTAIQNICPGHTQVLNHALLTIVQDEHLDTDRIYVYDSWIAGHAALYGKILFNNSSFAYYRQHGENQFGSGAGKIGQLLMSFRRNKTGDGHKYRSQVEYLVERNEKELRRIGAYKEFQSFLGAKGLAQRLEYISGSRLYRQNRLETLAFDMAVLTGNY